MSHGQNTHTKQLHLMFWGKRQITVVVFVQSNSDSRKETGQMMCFSFRAHPAHSHFVYKVAKNIQHLVNKILNKMVTLKKILMKCTIYIANWLNKISIQAYGTLFIFYSSSENRRIFF